jgi:hypothetical protein
MYVLQKHTLPTFFVRYPDGILTQNPNHRDTEECSIPIFSVLQGFLKYFDTVIAERLVSLELSVSCISILFSIRFELRHSLGTSANF